MKGFNKYLVYLATGAWYEIHSEKKLPLEILQKTVDGYIEIVYRRIPDLGMRAIICNEDGLMKGLPRNLLFPDFVGTIILCRREAID